MELNWLAIGVVTIGHFILGALWFSVFFGKQWMRIHHGDQMPSEKEMAELSKGMWKFMVSEFVATFLITIGLACLVEAMGKHYGFSGLHTGFIVWIAFILPMLTSSVIWGNDKKSVMCEKITISAVYRLIALLASGYILAIW